MFGLLVLITSLILIITNLSSSTTSKSTVEYTQRSDDVTYVNISIKAVLRDEEKVTPTYNGILYETTYSTQAQMGGKVTITPDMVFDDVARVGDVVVAEVSNSDDDSSIDLVSSNPQTTDITATNGQCEY